MTLFLHRMARVSFPALAVVLSACDSPQSVIDALRRDIATYATAPTAEAAAAIDANFDLLDSRIAKLRASGRDQEAAAFANERDTLRAQYAAARVGASLQKARQAVEGLGEAFRQAGETLGGVLKTNSAP
ncbi:MAG: hypothetical protein FGM15_09695 [Chthoniobacterales bacterium]|nr:hypothetical protein [Chthoniobacterales bacterium]